MENIKIGNTSYHVESIKSMSYTEFQKQFRGLINTDLKTTYETITGEKVNETNEQNEPEKPKRITKKSK